MKNILKVVVFTLLLVGCGEPSTPVNKHIDNTGKVLIVTVDTYPTHKTLNKNVWIPVKTEPEGLKGQTRLDGNECKIKVYEPKPIREDDDFTLTIGHELMHCLYGNYHK